MIQEKKQEKAYNTDVAIIGAGPVGLFAVFQCGMLGLKSVVIDSLPDIGGQCTALYPEKPIYDIPASPAVNAHTLIQNLEKQAAPFDPTYILNQQVVSISGKVNDWIIQTSANTAIQAKAIVIAAGAGAFGPNRPPLENIEAYEGISVFYMVRDKTQFAGQNLVIAGGGDSAVDWALSLQNFAKSIYVVHRRDKFRAAPDSVRQLNDLADQGKINLIVPAQLQSLEGNPKTGMLEGVRVRYEDGDEILIDADILLPFYGLSASLGPIADWGLNLDKHSILVDQSTSQTNIDGIYAVGDIAAYKRKLKLILTGFGEVAQAAHAIYDQIHPHQPLHFEHSTTKGLPKAS